MIPKVQQEWHTLFLVNVKSIQVLLNVVGEVSILNKLNSLNMKIVLRDINIKVSNDHHWYS